MNSTKGKILNNEKLTSKEVEDIIQYCVDGVEIVDEIEGEDRRWSRTNEVIIKICDKYFSITYEHGLTEYQENEYYSQIAVEVEKVEKVIKTTVWEEKK